jgi:4-diphosphocytidyl-2-C-methyl-D-erythritol kinase
VTGRPAAAPRGEAGAKVNLALAVTGRRDDGYHELRSVFLRLALHDRLEVGMAADPSGPHKLVIEGEPGLAVAGNLVLRAVEGLGATVGRPLPALRLRLRKHIPVAAGLAGGSSDAALALRLAMQAWDVPPETPGLPALAARLGSDVPFFMSRHAAALVSGIGESVEPLPAPDPVAGVLLVTPARRLSTAAVFVEFDADRASARAGIDRVAALATSLRGGLDGKGLDGKGLAALGSQLRDANDLWPAAARLSPELALVRDLLEQRLGRAFLLTGSGPTLFAIYPSPGPAVAAGAALEAAGLPSLGGAVIHATATSSRGGPS